MGGGDKKGEFSKVITFLYWMHMLHFFAIAIVEFRKNALSPYIKNVSAPQDVWNGALKLFAEQSPNKAFSVMNSSICMVIFFFFFYSIHLQATVKSCGLMSATVKTGKVISYDPDS